MPPGGSDDGTAILVGEDEGDNLSTKDEFHLYNLSSMNHHDAQVAVSIKKSSMMSSLAQLQVDFIKRLSKYTTQEISHDLDLSREINSRDIMDLATATESGPDEITPRLCTTIRHDGRLSCITSCESTESSTAKEKVKVGSELPKWLEHLVEEKLLFQINTKQQDLPWIVSLFSRVLDQIPEAFFWLRRKGCQWVGKNYTQPTGK